MSASSLRMRNKAKATQLNIPDDIVAMIEKIDITIFGNKRKNSILKDILGHSLCCLCKGVPSIELDYDLGGFRKIEYYCDNCASDLYERDDPKDRDSLANRLYFFSLSTMFINPSVFFNSS